MMPAWLLDPELAAAHHVFCLPCLQSNDGWFSGAGSVLVLLKDGHSVPHRGRGCGLRRGAIAQGYPVLSGGEAAVAHLQLWLCGVSFGHIV